MPDDCPACGAPLDSAPVTVHDQFQVDLPAPAPVTTYKAGRWDHLERQALTITAWPTPPPSGTPLPSVEVPSETGFVSFGTRLEIVRYA